MVKLVPYCSKVIAASIAAVLFTSCHVKDIHIGNGIDGNGNVTTEQRKVDGNFSKVDVSGGLNVTLEQSNTYGVEVEADENLQEHISTKVEDGTLIITTDENIDEAQAKNIHVKMPSLIKLNSTSGSSVKTDRALTGNEIDIKTGSGSEADLELEYDSINCEASSGSSVTLKGKALKLKTDSSSGSEIDAHDLSVNEVESQSSSGSSTSVHPAVSLNGKASSGSSIEYYGSPRTVTKEESSGGSVSKE